MDPTSGLFVGTESNYFSKRENCCSPSVFSCLFPVETTDWTEKTYGRDPLAPDLLLRTGGILRDRESGSVRL